MQMSAFKKTNGEKVSNGEVLHMKMRLRPRAIYTNQIYIHHGKNLIVLLFSFNIY